jgi:Peptidase S24-like
MNCAAMPGEPGERFRAFVRARLANLQVTQTAAERRGGLRKGFLGDLLRGQKHSVQAAKLEGLALALDVSVADLTAVMSDQGTAAPVAALGDASRLPCGAASGNRVGLQITEACRGWMIPRGVIPSDLEARARDLMLIQVGSDAMEPEIARTDVVVIDTAQRALSSEGTWLLNEGRAQVLRRVILTSREGQPCVILRASNQRYPDHFVSPDEVDVVGRCIGRFTLF